MSAFIFQCVPDRFDLRRELKPRHKDTWYATRYRSLMKPGDLVFFWMAGDPQIRGLYGWGKLTSTAYFKPAWESHGVDVVCEYKFDRPLLASQIRSQPTLENMLILRAPQSTNFLLSDTELSALTALISEHGNPAPQHKS